MKAEQLRGYLLEESLAYLIQSSGYKLITKPASDSGLKNSGAGLQVKGLGAWHQADVLGRLEIIPAFTFPMRLFAEAKFYESHPIGLGVVRNAVGTIIDLNNSPVKSTDKLPIVHKYHYGYTLFSTSGFNKQAIEMALVYGISLIDLSTNDYSSLLKVIYQTALEIITKFNNKGLVSKIRKNMRNLLETSEQEEIFIEKFNDQEIKSELADLVRVIKNYGKLYVGTVNAPFMLLLKANNPVDFENYSFSKEGEDHIVEMHWSSGKENGEKWTIKPENNDAYELSFKIPKILYKWIFNSNGMETQRALDIKRNYLSEISIYLSKPGIDKVIKLKLGTIYSNN